MSKNYAVDQTKLVGLVLEVGFHPSAEEGTCLLEAVAWVRGIEHTDHPECVSPVLGAMGRSLNDCLPDEPRQRLVPLIPDLPGTADDGLDEQRAYMALDWLIRIWLPTWLELSPACRADAAKVRELGRIVDLASAERAGPVVRQAREAAAAAWAAAWAAVGDTRGADDDAWGVVHDAAWDAREAAWAATGGHRLGRCGGRPQRRRSGAWDDAAGAVRDAVGATVAGPAAEVAGRAAAVTAGRAAAVVAMLPTVEQLQNSTIELHSRMTRIGHTTTAVTP